MSIGALPPVGLTTIATAPGAPATSAPAAGARAVPAGASTASSSGTAPDAASRAATSFERVLLEQLTTQLAATAAPEDGEGSGATSAYRDLLPRAMADSLAAAGGLGIAGALTRAPAFTPTTPATSATTPATTPTKPATVPSTGTLS